VKRSTTKVRADRSSRCARNPLSVELLRHVCMFMRGYFKIRRSVRFSVCVSVGPSVCVRLSVRLRGSPKTLCSQSLYLGRPFDYRQANPSTRPSFAEERCDRSFSDVDGRSSSVHVPGPFVRPSVRSSALACPVGRSVGRAVQVACERHSSLVVGSAYAVGRPVSRALAVCDQPV